MSFFTPGWHSSRGRISPTVESRTESRVDHHGRELVDVVVDRRTSIGAGKEVRTYNPGERVTIPCDLAGLLEGRGIVDAADRPTRPNWERRHLARGPERRIIRTSVELVASPRN